MAPVPPLCLDREVLHHATRTHSKLVHNFPRALPLAVPDVEAWKAGVVRLLDHAKAAIHDKTPPPTSLMDVPGLYTRHVQQQATALPRALRPLCDALSWTEQLHPRNMADAVARMAAVLTAHIDPTIHRIFNAKRWLVDNRTLQIIRTGAIQYGWARMIGLSGAPLSYSWPFHPPYPPYFQQPFRVDVE